MQRLDLPSTEEICQTTLKSAAKQLASLCWRQYCWSLALFSTLALALIGVFFAPDLTDPSRFGAERYTALGLVLVLIALAIAMYYHLELSILWILKRNSTLREIPEVKHRLRNCWIASFNHGVYVLLSRRQAKCLQRTVKRHNPPEEPSDEMFGDY